MKIIKFLGKLLSLPFKIVLVTTLIGLIPIKTINNWLSGYGKYNLLYWKFAKYTASYAVNALKRGNHPTLMNILRYSDDLETVLFLNDKKEPNIIHIGKSDTNE